MGISSLTVRDNLYIGRFAPSPSGKLHIGSFLSAITSYIDAKHNNGLWKLRIDDIDSERSKKIYSESIIKILKDFLLDPDEIYYQTDHLNDYINYLDRIPKEKTYFCECTRKIISALPQHDIGAIYDGRCLNKNLYQGALRIQMKKINFSFNDLNLGLIELDKTFVSDFIVRGKNQFAYVFCCVIDDYLQEVNTVVRGSDLVFQTFQQRYLQELFSFPLLSYFHHPVLYDEVRKISKSDQDEEIHPDNRTEILMKILKILNQKINPNINSYKSILEHAKSNKSYLVSFRY
ncbi:MAG: tRNA glutamyl-Q(34) synthetase GluQRS [Betaproteobacteria bacterium]|nr:tRNA glutamyl-Q(34) synthetase GluQRS [Betaproteobacteria bacterium]